MEKVEKLNFRVYPYYVGNDEHSICSPYEDDWELDENEQPIIVGQTNVDEMIQSYEKECDINNIIAQHIALGTMEELSVSPQDDSIVDVSNIPNDINTQNAKAKQVAEFYNSLTKEQKALFNGYDDFLLHFDKLFKNVDEHVENSEVQNNE